MGHPKNLAFKLSKCFILASYRPGSFSHFSDYGIGKYSPDGLTETIMLYEFNNEQSLLEAVKSHLQVFTNSAGCVLVLYSCLLTRSLEKYVKINYFQFNTYMTL